jgi:hypothetical protein
MWEYSLNLTPWEHNLFIRHLWEVRGYKFKYYFFEKNCGYRIAQVLDLVSGSNLARQHRPWYLPEQLFLNLSSLSNQNGGPLLALIEFRPSSQRMLYSQLDALSKIQLENVETIVSKGETSSLDGLPNSAQITVLDAVLAYIKYYKVSHPRDTLGSLNHLEQNALIRRLSLPPAQPKKGVPPKLSTPNEGDRSAYISIGYTHSRENQSATVEVGAFKRDSETRNNLEGNELNVLNFK